MKSLTPISVALALALAAFASVGHCQPSADSTRTAALSNADTQFVWREASGPKGEQDAAALPLYRAVFAHDRRATAELLAGGASPITLLYPNRWSVLMVATAYQDTDTIDLLAHQGADLDYTSADPADATALAVALNAALGEALRSNSAKPDFRTFIHLLDLGANTNVEFGYHSDIAIFAATLGQMELVNEVLARGYRRDLAKLTQTLHIRLVNRETEPAKQKAIKTIDRLQRP